MTAVVTIDFHVTSDCNQECLYCWGPQAFENPVDTAKDRGLEVALSATGDGLTREFLDAAGDSVDLVSLPLDGSSEEVSSRTKKEGHVDAVMKGLDLLGKFPGIDMKVATPVTRQELDDVPNIVRLLEGLAAGMTNRLFCNVFQAFPRAMADVAWSGLLVTGEEFQELQRVVEAVAHPFRINWSTHQTPDRLYVMIFPDGTLTVPSGPDFLNYGPFLAVDDLGATLARTDFDAPKHQSHSRGWSRSEPNR